MIDHYTEADIEELRIRAYDAESAAYAAERRRAYDVASERHAEAAELFRELANCQDEFDPIGWRRAGTYRSNADLHERLSEHTWAHWSYYRANRRQLKGADK